MCFNLDPLLLHNDVILCIQLFWIAYQSGLFGGNTEVRSPHKDRMAQQRTPGTLSHRLLDKVVLAVSTHSEDDLILTVLGCVVSFMDFLQIPFEPQR